MSHEQFSVDVHRRLCACDPEEFAADPIRTLVRLARRSALRHPIIALQFLWWRRQQVRRLLDAQ